jgi:hypothetical protein
MIEMLDNMPRCQNEIRRNSKYGAEDLIFRIEDTSDTWRRGVANRRTADAR